MNFNHRDKLFDMDYIITPKMENRVIKIKKIYFGIIRKEKLILLPKNISLIFIKQNMNI